VEVLAEHDHRGDVSLVLQSPSGTRSNILSHRRLDNSTDGISFTFMTVHHWGEDPAGVWTLEVEDRSQGGSPSSDGDVGAASSRHQRGRLVRWSLIFYGVAGERPNHRGAGNPGGSKTHQSRPAAQKNTDSSEPAHEVGTSEVKELMEKEAASSDSVQIQSKDEKVMKRNDRQRKWLCQRGFSRQDADFLVGLFETEQKEKRWKSASDNSVEQEKSEMPGHGASRHHGGSSKSQRDWQKRTYDTSRHSYWNPHNRNLESVEGDRQRIVDQNVDGTESWRELAGELLAVLEEEDN